MSRTTTDHATSTGRVRARTLVRRRQGALRPTTVFAALTGIATTSGTPLPSVDDHITLPTPSLPETRRDASILLESAHPSGTSQQKSFLVTSVAFRLTATGRRVTVSATSKESAVVLPNLADTISDRLGPDGTCTLDLPTHTLTVTVPERPTNLSETERLSSPTSLTVVSALHDALTPDPSAPAESVFIAGMFGYDLIAAYEELPPPTNDAPGTTPNLPDYDLVVAEDLVVIDHVGHTTTSYTTTFLPPGDTPTPRALIADISPASQRLTTLDTTVTHLLAHPDDALEPHPPTGDVTITCDLSDTDYGHIVTHIKDHIRAGDVFQAVPSRTFRAPCPDPFDAYLRLRAANPSPHLFYVSLGNTVCFGASPESAVAVDGTHRTATITPIAGTRPRGRHPDGTLNLDADNRHEISMRLDPKETAEHMMLVDLARNDIARIATPGTRHVTRLLRTDKYSHVMHLTSEVQGHLRDGLTALDAYAASMNMGTLTGAPKLKAMQLLRHYETGRRGAYGGAVGYLSGIGTLDTAIIIRAAVVQDGTAYVRAGAGVVADSTPEGEADETRRKAAAVLTAITGQPVGHIASDPAAPRERMTSDGGEAESAAAPADCEPSQDTARVAVTRDTPRVLLLDNEDSFTYNLRDELATEGAAVEVYRNSTHLDQLTKLARDAHLVVLSPGPGTPTAAGNLIPLIQAAHRDVPMLGVCLGHQALSVAFGGHVSSAPTIVHGRTSPIRHTGHPMFDGIPTRTTVARYHSLVATNLPAELTATAHLDDGTATDVIMALAHTTLPLWGLQFHPESVMSETGTTMIRTALRHALDPQRTTP